MLVNKIVTIHVCTQCCIVFGLKEKKDEEEKKKKKKRRNNYKSTRLKALSTKLEFLFNLIQIFEKLNLATSIQKFTKILKGYI